ncbi:MAG: LytTR family transcriptional regulator, partial [Gottschalkiaceae bacterium]
PNNLLIIKEKQDYHMINMPEINYIEKEHNLLVINTIDKKYYTNLTLSEIEKKLTSNFLRTHKSYIVNLKNIQRIEPYGDSSFIIYFKNTDELSNALITKEKMKLLQL